MPARVPHDATRGFIVPIGGRIGDSDILKRFIALCGGHRSHVAIVPTASTDPTTGAEYEALFRSLGAKSARTLAIDSRADCEDTTILATLERADGVFLTGGNQLKLSTTLGGTAVAKLLRRRNAAGMHVAGTSAGAAFLSEHMIAFGEEGPTPRVGMVTLAPGLGLTNRVMIDQHFRQRDRLGRLLMALSLNPFAVGVGLDEDTAAFIGPDDIIDIHGSGGITCVDPSGVEFSAADHTDRGQPVSLIGVKLHVLTHGASYNLHSREAMAPRRETSGRLDE
ncbi:MAG: cyanophycinase [Gemmatimonadaceae bacterium]